MNETELAKLKQDERAMWAKGDYAAVARDLFWDVGAHIVGRVGVSRGDVVLDVACGTGNAAIAQPRPEVKSSGSTSRPSYSRPGGQSRRQQGSASSGSKETPRRFPPASDFAQPPPLWGTEEHVRALFERSGIELRFERAR